MSATLIAVVTLYLFGVIVAVIVGSIMIWDGKDDIQRYERRRAFSPAEQEISEARRKISFGLGIVKGGFLVWPLLLTRSIKRNLQEAERYTR